MQQLRSLGKFFWPTGVGYGVAWNGSVWCLVGINTCYTSSDTVTWTSRSIPTGIWSGLAWNGTNFVAVAKTEAAYSPDGITWTTVTIGTASYASIGVTSGGLFFTYAESSATYAEPPPTWYIPYATSSDGISWELGNISYDLTAPQFNSAVADFGGPNQASSISQGGPSVCFAIDSFVFAVGTSSFTLEMSNPAPVYDPPYIEFAFAWACAAYGSGIYVMSGQGVLNTSVDSGASWQNQSTTPSDFYSMAYSALIGQFIAVGEDDIYTNTPSNLTSGGAWTALGAGTGFSRIATTG